MFSATLGQLGARQAEELIDPDMSQLFAQRMLHSKCRLKTETKESRYYSIILRKAYVIKKAVPIE